MLSVSAIIDCHHATIRINSDDTGYSYATIFEPYLTGQVTEVVVEDPYIRSHHQVGRRPLQFSRRSTNSRRNYGRTTSVVEPVWCKGRALDS